jgi:peptidyl-prolyl cis-trans isomerase A (cyclophilin A)
MKHVILSSALVALISNLAFAAEPPATVAPTAKPATPPTTIAPGEPAKTPAPTAKPAAAPKNKWADAIKAGKDLYATFKTSEGTIVVRLFPKEAPKTVENFVGLATGQKDWTHPGTQERMTGKPLYDGTIFHRCISNFMVQGGDPLGKGIGGPGYKFEDEVNTGKTFDRPGILAMANSGPNTNGSQFFITVAATPWLNNRHTIFGEVVSGQEVANKVANEIPKGPGDKPVKDVVLQKLEVSDKAPAGAAKKIN